jgi:hypothetical protein
VASDTLAAHRRKRLEREFRLILADRIDQRIDELSRTAPFVEVTDAMLAGGLDPYEAADRILAVLVAGTGDPIPNP